MVDLSEIIAEEFGANAEYVQGLLERFRTNPDLVDDSWRSYFSEILGDGAGTAPRSGRRAPRRSCNRNP
jgi:2-oxoglutarate dehydrogenase complex dehydrogenase (E1) component-like enzyme